MARLTKHGDGTLAFWLCAKDEAKADECFGTHDAAALMDAARNVQG